MNLYIQFILIKILDTCRIVIPTNAMKKKINNADEKTYYIFEII